MALFAKSARLFVRSSDLLAPNLANPKSNPNPNSEPSPNSERHFLILYFLICANAALRRIAAHSRNLRETLVIEYLYFAQISRIRSAAPQRRICAHLAQMLHRIIMLCASSPLRRITAHSRNLRERLLIEYLYFAQIS